MTAEQVEAWMKRDEQLFKEQLDKLIKAFPEPVIRKACEQSFEETLEFCKRKREHLFEEYRIAAAKGVPYAERVKLIPEGGLKAIDDMEKRAIEMRANGEFKIRPMEFWISYGDYDYMKQIGFKRFVSMFIEEIVYV